LADCVDESVAAFAVNLDLSNAGAIGALGAWVAFFLAPVLAVFSDIRASLAAAILLIILISSIALARLVAQLLTGMSTREFLTAFLAATLVGGVARDTL